MDPAQGRAAAFINHLLANPALNNLNPLQKEEQILQFLRANAQSLVPTLASPQFFPGRPWSQIWRLLYSALTRETDRTLKPQLEELIRQKISFVFATQIQPNRLPEDQCRREMWEFTGRLLQRFAPGSAARSAEQVYRAMIGSLPEGVAAGDYAVAAEDKPALAVSAATAAAWGGHDLTAAVRNCAGLSVGALAGVPTPAAVGECTLAPVRRFPDTATLFGALRDGSVRGVWTTTADPDVPDGVVVLVDRKPTLVPAENVVAIYRRNELGKMQLRAINELAGVLDTASLIDMVRQVRSGADPRWVAEAWLAANPLGR